jgi:hypothetical protein
MADSTVRVEVGPMIINPSTEAPAGTERDAIDCHQFYAQGKGGVRFRNFRYLGLD